MSILPGIYRIEAVLFDSEIPKRVLDLKNASSLPDTIVRVFPNYGGSNQLWDVTPSDRIEGSYLFRAVAPPSYLYVSVNSLVGNPSKGTEFKLLKVEGPKTPDEFQIYIDIFETKVALQAPDNKEEPVTGALLVPGDKRQIVRFVRV
ncbi:hypothetical protein Clacol_000083 [Clathrus columnatus]|uniref:Ricin B lectin domain-containing protein n=1 Tax=Clathrus columnatus TaxID=1419009 RepID=A0AAV4ZW60_9AGAM|nr:hypothetical protein Clacol_000083 [Clathrus columnatus]